MMRHRALLSAIGLSLLLACGGAGQGGNGAGGAGASSGGRSGGPSGQAGGGGSPCETPACTPVPTPRLEGDLATYAGGPGHQAFKDIVRLSDGTFVVAGGARDLDWLPKDLPRTELALDEIVSTSPGQVGFLLHLEDDLTSIKRVLHFPANSVRDISRIRSTELPGQPTGILYISGMRDGAADGYFIARLEGNFVDEVPRVKWARNVSAEPRRASGGEGTSHYKVWQPWDVGRDGRVVYGTGAEFDSDWAAVHGFDASGKEAIVENWPVHWTPDGEHHGPASAYSGGVASLLRSGIVLKAGRRGSLRSHTQADWDHVGKDGNGRSDRPHRWPDDYFFNGPCLSKDDCPGGPGYTGYKTSGKPTQRLGGVVIDRRTGAMYFGYSTQSVLPGGNPDFEPAVVAMDETGKLLWWNRLYEETKDNSSPDQYVDGLAIDYANDQLVVLGRAHGNNVVNLWRGDKVAANPEAKGFQNQFTGNNGNIHISWLGKFTLAEGTLRHATYVAEYNEGTSRLGAAFADGLLEGWPNPNAGWPDVNTTRCGNTLSVDLEGNVLVACTGRRSFTTSNAYQKMMKPGEGRSVWNAFTRVYAANLGSLRYSSLVVGTWDPSTEQGGGNTELAAIAAVNGGLVAVGRHKATDGQADGAPIPTRSVPSWGRSTPEGETGILVNFTFP